MAFLRRLLGGTGPGNAEPDPQPADAAALDEEERARELELARFDQDRIDDLARRQQRYADRSWRPPAQGGEKRAGDDEEPD